MTETPQTFGEWWVAGTGDLHSSHYAGLNSRHDLANAAWDAALASQQRSLDWWIDAAKSCWRQRDELKAELRAAREVVEAARQWDNEPEIQAALATYDRLTTSEDKG